LEGGGCLLTSVNEILNIKTLAEIESYLSSKPKGKEGIYFEKIVSEAIAYTVKLPYYTNDQTSISHTYYVKWYGKNNPIEKAQGSNPDIKVICHNFHLIVEATIKTETTQCSQEYSQALRHFNEHIRQNQMKRNDGYILFITKFLHEDSYNAIYILNNDPNNLSYRFVPIDYPNLIKILEISSIAFTMMHVDFRDLLNDIIFTIQHSPTLSIFQKNINKKINDWRKKVLEREKSACLGFITYELLKDERHSIEISDVYAKIKTKRNYKHIEKLIEGDINDKMILNALIDNGFARITGKTFGNVELIQFVPQSDSVKRLYQFAQKVESLS
jgi:hypothetical protein